MIEQGIKKEEYREDKDYWKKRLCRSKGLCDYGHTTNTTKSLEN